MNSDNQKKIDRLTLWLEKINSNRRVNVSLMLIVIATVIIFFVLTYPESLIHGLILIVPILAGINIFYLYSKKAIIRETANFTSWLLFMGFVFFSLTILIFGLAISNSL